MGRYNHRTNPYSGFGVYEGTGGFGDAQCPPGSHAVVDPFGSGVFVCMPDSPSVPAAPLPTGCPTGQVGFPSLGIPCTPMPGQPQTVPPISAPQCPDGQIGWPSLGLPCMTVPNAPPPPGPTPAPQATNPCPSGQFGWPPFVPCMALPATPSAPPAGGCPPGTFGLPPNCMSFPAAPPPVAPRPAAPPSAPTAPPPSTTPWMTYGLIGAGVLAVVYIMKPKRAVANRRHR